MLRKNWQSAFIKALMMNKNSVTEMKRTHCTKNTGSSHFEAVMQFMENYYVSVIKDYQNEKGPFGLILLFRLSYTLYDELNKLYQNNFHLIYSKQRVPQRCIDKIESVLKENALGLLTEKMYLLGKRMVLQIPEYLLPFPKGLYRLIKSVKS